MDFTFLLFAFAFGLTFKLVGLPPLIGYLVAGFILNALEYNLTENLSTIADLGITIMLFTIGLKLNLRDLVRREVIASSTLHTSLWVLLFSSVIYVLAGLVSLVSNIEFNDAILIAFALSFSSTVCVVKVLEESGESSTRHGKIAIAVLVMQDVFAVIYMVIATGKVPSIYALALLALFPLVPFIYQVINRSGHGELLPLTGFIFALGGYHLFEAVDIKGDLGALIAGILLSKHSKAVELSKSLLSFKDLFLIGFFLSIGLTALPTWSMVVMALVLCLFIPLKFIMFYGLFSSLRLRARTAYLSALVLSNYSEFGLIIGALAVSIGLLGEEWLVILALATSVSFIITSVAYGSSHQQYTKMKSRLKKFEKQRRLPEDIYPVLNEAEFLVVGMGRVGTGACKSLSKLTDKTVWGIDAHKEKVAKLKAQGIQVALGDGEDIDFWENTDIRCLKLVLLALPSIDDAININRQLKNAGFKGKVAAVARYQDEVDKLLINGIDKVFNFYNEAGLGFAEESLAFIDSVEVSH
ncbi:cation:proton antiporter [Alteromonas sp. 5E99-2]|uniref:cation:proton antiporter family protein n=1 Tax=Alteromonas sp. 5E99-2 TaxID=2817683 RepID=UPI001A9A28DE|nr:cation:proton antiporter family protein [Alteromonas sp. 5E99-2]MBO1255053.1 cation:proton antiporter [Alteromonas sp. 5E99-2]